MIRLSYKGKTYGERELDSVIYNDAVEIYGDDLFKIADYISFLFKSGAIYEVEKPS